jgi:hypothetical protein
MARFDWHIHTGLSACAEKVMTPRQILARARDAGLDMIAITDHNASGNLAPALRLAPAFGVHVVPGVEVMSREEVHVLALFREAAAAAAFQLEVDRLLPAAPNAPELFGEQLLYDEEDEIIGEDERLRQVGTALGLDPLVALIQRCDGVAIPAHVNRARFSLRSQLGFIDPAAAFAAVELQRSHWVREGHRPGDRVAGFPALTGSDAHFLEDVGRTCMDLPGVAPTLDAALAALAGGTAA